MNHITMRSLAVAWAMLPLTAVAAPVILDYQGQAFTTAAQSLPIGAPTLTPTFAVGESIDLAITLNAPLGDNLVDAAVNPLALRIMGPSLLNFFPPSSGADFSDSFDFSTNARGVITGWSFSIINGPQQGTSTSAIFAVTSQAGNGIGQDTALATYFSPYYANPGNPPNCCFSSASVNKAGSWTAAPEIDPSLGVGGLTLLLGIVAIVHSASARRTPRP